MARKRRPKPGRTRTTDIRDANELLAGVAAAAHLAEGPEGVRRILRAVAQGGPIPIHDLARTVSLPVPVTAAIRRELEKLGLLNRQGGVAFTERGLELVHSGLGLSRYRLPARPLYPIIPDELEGALHRMRQLCDGRPEVDVTLDQSHATPETALRRALYLYEHDALEEREIVILGDDDLTSLAIALLSDFLGFRRRRLVVLEIDERLVAYIADAARDIGCTMDVLGYDLRQDLPREMADRFDVFFTDPPYTLEGLDLFASRGVEALRLQVGKQGYICFGHRTPDDTGLAIGALAEMGLAPVEIVPDFNRYVGAQVLAGSSQMIRTVATSELRPRVKDAYSGPLYTADRKRQRDSHAR